MTFRQDFDADLRAFADAFFYGPPFALSRFGDGEESLLRKRMFYVNKGVEQWHSGGTDWARGQLATALRFRGPGYYVGIASSCCAPKAHQYLARHSRLNSQHLTFATLFCHGNYDRTLELNLARNAVVVGSHPDAEVRVPANAINEPWDVDALLTRLASVDKPILVAAGPAACWIVQQYWARSPKQTIVDVGALFDPVLHGCASRPYHDERSGWREHCCVW